MPTKKSAKKPLFPTKKVGKVKNAKQHSYNGITYKSGLELYMAKLLEENNIHTPYEDTNFVLVPKFTCPSTSMEFTMKTDKGTKIKRKVFDIVPCNIRQISYTPDWCNLEEGWLIETKGIKTDSFVLRWKLFRKYLHDNNIALRLYMPNTQEQCRAVLEDILKHRC